MLFITNRTPKVSIRFKKNRAIDFDISNNSASNSVYYCKRASKGNYVEIGSAEFMKNVKDSKIKEVLFLIHGFSNLPEPDIFPSTELLQRLFDRKERNLVQVIPLIWPCDNDFGVMIDYWDDQKAADQSGYAFSRVLEKFMAWRRAEKGSPCLKRINVLAHSMGNRVLRETLRAWDKYDLTKGVPMLFRNIFLVAADIVNESLERGRPGELICQASRNVSVYYASDDLALRGSKAANLKNRVASRRLGHSGPENMSKVPSNVYSLDCDNFNTKYDHPTGHTYFLTDKDNKPGAVFNHIYNTVKQGRVFPKEESRRSIILS